MKRVLIIAFLLILVGNVAMAQAHVFVRLDGIWLDDSEYTVSESDDGCRLEWKGRSADFEMGEGVLVFDILSYDIMKVHLTRFDSTAVPPVLEAESLNWYGELFGYMESFTPKLHSFSYAENCEKWPEGTPGVKTTGFVNTDTSPVIDMESAVKRAAAECGISYDISMVQYDSASGMWCVTFMTYMQSGGSISVYLDANGITHRMIYSE